MLNKSTTRRNTQQLLEYAHNQLEDASGGQAKQLRKMTLNIDWSSHDVVKRIAILEGVSKTEVMRRAINLYSDVFGDDLLYPLSQ